MFFDNPKPLVDSTAILNGIQREVHKVLKPLGFRKKGNEWNKVLPSGHTLYFAADKGSYSDGYNFDARLAQPPGEVRLRDWCAFAILDQEQDRAIDPFCHHGFDCSWIRRRSWTGC